MKCARSVPSTTLDAHTQRHTHTQTHTQTRACIRTEPNRTTPSTRLDAPDRRLPLVRVTPTSRKASVQKSTPTRHVRLFFGLRQDPPPFFSHHDPSIRVPPHHTIIANLENTVSDTSHAPMKKVRARKRAAVVASCRIARCRSDRIRSVLKSNNILTTSSKRSFFFCLFF